jgi:hypothetical protein
VLFKAFNLAITPPFVTLHSASRVLGADPGVLMLAVCPKCRSVYPSSDSRLMKEECDLCHVSLFSSDHTKRGNRRAMKMPIIRYPYLPLSTQIASILRVPGVEALLDNWRTKPRNAGEYADIFDGRMCRQNLKAPDGSLFFSNRPHETKGPDNELRIGVNMGIDWCVFLLPSYNLTRNGSV